MTPDEVGTINRKLDALASKTGDLSLAVGVLASEFKAHREMEQQAATAREATCPKAAVVSKLVVDVDAIAGVQRSVLGRVKDIEVWKAECMTAEMVDGAERSIIWAPFRWFSKNAEKVLIAVAIAYIIFRLGF